MSIKKGLIVGLGAGLGAGLGSIVTALMMTKQCHEMMEYNKKESEEINIKINELNAKVELAETAFNTYKDKVEFCDKEAKEMHTAISGAFRTLAQEGKSYQKDIQKVSSASIELIKKELKSMLSEANNEIDNKKKETVDEMTDTLEQLKFMFGTLNDGIQNEKHNVIEDDITEKMIEQLESDNGRTSKKRKIKK